MSDGCIIANFFENIKKIVLNILNIKVNSTKGDNSPIINGNDNVYKK